MREFTPRPYIQLRGPRFARDSMLRSDRADYYFPILITAEDWRPGQRLSLRNDVTGKYAGLMLVARMSEQFKDDVDDRGDTMCAVYGTELQLRDSSPMSYSYLKPIVSVMAKVDRAIKKDPPPSGRGRGFEEAWAYMLLVSKAMGAPFVLGDGDRHGSLDQYKWVDLTESQARSWFMHSVKSTSSLLLLGD